MKKKLNGSIYDAKRWGFSSEAIADIGNRLYSFWERFKKCFNTKTRDMSSHALIYLKGLLEMDTKRNFANMARRVIELDEDGQKLQHFMSDSPWSARLPIKQVQEEIKETPGLAGGYLLLDESANEKAGSKSAGAGRQYNGRLGKVEMSQVGVFLAYYKDVIWSWVDGELFFPEHWFSKKMEQERKRVGMPEERKFATKIELGWQMIQRAKANGLPFKAVGCDDLYGRSGWLRRQMDEAGIVYMADIPEDMKVYVNKPDFGVPTSVVPKYKGKGEQKPRVLGGDKPVEVRQVCKLSEKEFKRFKVRDMERGELNDPFLMLRVWTIRDQKLAAEWLVIRHEYEKSYSYALCNGSADTDMQELAKLKCVRHFVECSNQDAKSEIGWDELQARKYRAWEHHLALTIMASWFIAQIKYDWANSFPKDAELARQLEVEMLPALSVSNVRELLKAVMPLQQLTPEQATNMVIQHLVNRSRSTASRLRAQQKKGALT